MDDSMASYFITGWFVLFLLALLYDRLVVDRIERIDPPIGVTAWEVIFGVLGTIIVFGLIVGPRSITGIDAMFGLLFLFSGSGIPMIMGSYWRHGDRVRASGE